MQLPLCSCEYKNGIKKYVTEIVAENVLLLYKKTIDKAEINARITFI